MCLLIAEGDERAYLVAYAHCSRYLLRLQGIWSIEALPHRS